MSSKCVQNGYEMVPGGPWVSLGVPGRALGLPGGVPEGSQGGLWGSLGGPWGDFGSLLGAKMTSKLSQKLVWNQSVILGTFLMPKWSFLGTKSDHKLVKSQTGTENA